MEDKNAKNQAYIRGLESKEASLVDCINHLENAIEQIDPEYDPQYYCRIYSQLEEKRKTLQSIQEKLRQLRAIYWHRLAAEWLTS